MFQIQCYFSCIQWLHCSKMSDTICAYPIAISSHLVRFVELLLCDIVLPLSSAVLGKTTAESHLTPSVSLWQPVTSHKILDRFHDCAPVVISEHWWMSTALHSVWLLSGRLGESHFISTYELRLLHFDRMAAMVISLLAEIWMYTIAFTAINGLCDLQSGHRNHQQ